MNSTVSISAIVTAYDRTSRTIETIRRIEACRPEPDEILVHVDANQQVCAQAVRAAFPHLRVLLSADAVGPGGGRNKLVAEAHNEIIASFDDDSFPLDSDYFARASALFDKFPVAALIAANIFDLRQPITGGNREVSPTASFGAGGVVFRRSRFQAAGGFVPLVVAYGMEEEDLSIRLLEKGYVLLTTPWLRVFHDTDLSHHKSAAVTSRTIANIALLAYLRYPWPYWLYGALQVGNRVAWCLRAGRFDGVLSGIAAIPGHVFDHLHLRKPVSIETMRRRRALRMFPLKTFTICSREPSIDF